jgi:hypothetical protein
MAVVKRHQQRLTKQANDKLLIYKDKILATHHQLFNPSIPPIPKDPALHHHFPMTPLGPTLPLHPMASADAGVPSLSKTQCKKQKLEAVASHD